MRQEKSMFGGMIVGSAAAMVALCGGIAWGAPEQEETLVMVVSPDDEGDVRVTRNISSMMTDESGDTVRVTIEGVDAKVFVNGERVGEFKTDGDWVEQSFGEGEGRVTVRKQAGGLLSIERGGAGMVVTSDHLVFKNALQWVGPGQYMMSLAPEMEAFGQGFGLAQSFFVDEPPKVMLGVTMAPPSPEQARDLGLDPSKATVFGTVIEGLPAAKAGLRASDIVVGVDGADDASQEALREKLATLEPGQVLTLKVARDGRVEEVRVALEAYDPERLGMPSQVWLGEMFEGDDPELQALRDEQERVKGEWAEALERSLNADGQRARARAAAEATKLQEQMQDLTTRIARRMSKRAVTEFFNNQSPMGLEMRVAPQVMNDREGNLIIVPQITPTPPGAPSPRGLGGSEDVLRERDARIRELEERLGAMQEKMERLESLLQELKARSGDE